MILKTKVQNYALKLKYFRPLLVINKRMKCNIFG